MKLPRKPTIFNHFIKSTPSSPKHDQKLSSSSSSSPSSSPHTLLFHANTSTFSSSSSSHNLVSSKQPKPISKIASFDLISPPESQYIGGIFTNFDTNHSSEKHPKIEFFSTHLFNSSKELKPIDRRHFLYPMAQKLHQKRLFSSDRSDPNSVKPINVSATVVAPFESDSSAPIDAGSSIRKPISLWPGMYHSPVTNALWEARSSIFEKLPNVSSDDAPPPSQSELVTNTPSKSRTSISYKFSTDYILREQYRNPWNEIRMGKLLEDLDALAGTISFKHCSSNDSSTRPLMIVTASVDRMVLKKPIRVDADLKIMGAVTWVGRSSMEIQLEVSQSSEETSNPSDPLALTANFTFVARDSTTGKSAPINQISPETENEKLLWEEAEERNKMRKMKRVEQKKDVEGIEVKRLNELLAEGRIFCDMPALADRDSILIRDTCLQNSLICQPQQRNTHGRIFGGFLMRRAFELAYATAYSFAGSAPCFMEVDHVDFLKPVDVGNFLRFKSCILYTELENLDQPLINVEVVAHVTRPELRSSEVSNKFYFTFTVKPEAAKDGPRIRNVVPVTEEEARRVIERMNAEITHGHV